MHVRRMWILMKPSHIALIAIWCTSNLVAPDDIVTVEPVCDGNQEAVDWNLRENKLPIPANNFTSILNKTAYKTPVFILKGENLTAEVSVLLFAVPDIKNVSLCPLDIGKNMDFRRHVCETKISGNASHPHSFKAPFDSIMTGCFYFVIRNGEGKYWQLGPEVLETNYTYVNTKLKLIDNVIDKPEHRKSPKELIAVIEVPLICMQLGARLYECERNVTNATGCSKDWILDPAEGGKKQLQSCMIFLDDNCEAGVRSKCGEANTDLKIEQDLLDKGRTWTVKVIWKNLQYGGHAYSIEFFRSMPYKCEFLGYFEIWKPIDSGIFYQGDSDASNVQNEIEKNDIPLIIGISCSLVGLIVIAMFVYWKWRCSRFMINRETGDNEESVPLQTFGSSFDGKESIQILILYVKGPPLLTNAIRNLKDYLKRTFTCHIRDVYESKEWLDSAVLSATEWVEQQLKAGSKVVWIDTPEFRSLLNDKGKKYNGDDFRGEALPHAVDLIKPLFQDAQTQYSRHFVVRIKGFEVDDRQADPLQTVTPHVRYNIPDHLSDLCEHLMRPSKPMENTNDV